LETALNWSSKSALTAAVNNSVLCLALKRINQVYETFLAASTLAQTSHENMYIFIKERAACCEVIMNSTSANSCVELTITMRLKVLSFGFG